MFKAIGIATARCNFCGAYGTVAILDTRDVQGGLEVSGCERCWRATGRAAELLRVVRLGKAPKAKRSPNRARKPRSTEPRAIIPPSGDDEHGGGVLIGTAHG